MKLYIDKKPFFQKSSKGGERLVSAVQAAKLLLHHSSLKNLRLYPESGSYFFYEEELGYYKTLQPNGALMLVGKVLSLLEHEVYESVPYASRVFSQLRQGQNSYFGSPQFTRNILIFKNGALNLETGEFGSFSPKYFTVSGLSYKYDPDAKCEKFFDFLHNFCDGHVDRMALIRAWLYAVVHQRLHNQVFISIVGVAATGKSTMAQIATALIGKEATVTVSLRSLHSNEFEIINLLGKKLILISDSEEYMGNLDILKQIVGGDALKGRIKYVQGSFEVIPEGFLVMVANHALKSRDASNAIGRRQITFVAERVTRKRDVLIQYVDGSWKGTLAEELPGIFNYIYKDNPKEVDLYLQKPSTMVPSLSSQFAEAAESLNPMLQWVREELEKGSGAFVGFKIQEGAKGEIENARRMSLYPAYHSWCKRVGIFPVSQKRFSGDLVDTLRLEGYTTTKVKREQGAFLTGVQLRKDVYNRDRVYGAPLVQEEASRETLAIGTGGTTTHTGTSPVSLIGSTYRPPVRGSKHPRLSPTLYEDYMEKLEKTPFKDSLSKVGRKMSPELVDELVSTYCAERKVLSPGFRERAFEVIQRGVSQIQKWGGIPYTYKPMGVSPRIIPWAYRNTINNTKKIVRERCYELMGGRANEQGMILVDLDIKSCYTSILLGLYPDPLRALQLAIEQGGLWNFIKKEFEANGRLEVYNKAAVKICVYSSFFLGGNRAMMDGITESFRKDFGLTQKEFQNSTYYEECHTIARDVTSEMMNSSVIVDFKAISQWIRKAYEDEYLIGPTGHAYLVTEETFKTAYPNYLQSFEFALLAQTILEVVKKFPEVEIIGHYHDGNVIALPIEKKDAILADLLEKFSEVGQDLGLAYTQKLEVKRFFPEDGSKAD